MAATETTNRTLATGSDRLLRYAAVAFLVTHVVHGADHARRGNDVVSQEVFVAGNLLALLGLLAVILVFVRHRFAPAAATAVGFASALGFAASHLLPYWSMFSDSFTHPGAGSGVTAVSWLTALLGITAGLMFGAAGAAVLRTRGRAVPPKPKVNSTPRGLVPPSAEEGPTP